jgi:hypothetical protein
VWFLCDQDLSFADGIDNCHFSARIHGYWLASQFLVDHYLSLKVVLGQALLRIFFRGYHEVLCHNVLSRCGLWLQGFDESIVGDRGEKSPGFENFSNLNCLEWTQRCTTLTQETVTGHRRVSRSKGMILRILHSVGGKHHCKMLRSVDFGESDS